MKIKLQHIQPSPFQVRGKMNGQPLADLKASMAEAGQAVPIKVRPAGKAYELVYGHRRMEAAKQLGWKDIEAIVEQLSDEQAMVQALAENLTRDDLEPADEGRAYKRLIDEQGWDWKRIVIVFGVNDKRIDAALKVLRLPQALQAKVENMGAGRRSSEKRGRIGMYHVQEAAQHAPADFNIKVVEKAAREGLSVEHTRRVAKAIAAAPTDRLKTKLIEHDWDPFVHDAGRIREQIKRTPHRDPVADPPKKRPDEDWRKSPTVAQMLRYIQQYREDVKRMRDAVKAGKLAPEAKPFMVGKLRGLIQDIETLIALLEE
jgi:ParB family chromosome partitioning protein